MKTELGVMTVQEHYAISNQNPYALAGHNCCRWHQKMPVGYRGRVPNYISDSKAEYNRGYQAGYRARKTAISSPDHPKEDTNAKKLRDELNMAHRLPTNIYDEESGVITILAAHTKATEQTVRELTPYLQHKPDCGVHETGYMLAANPCSCGLAALSPTDMPGEKG